MRRDLFSTLIRSLHNSPEWNTIPAWILPYTVLLISAFTLSIIAVQFSRYMGTALFKRHIHELQKMADVISGINILLDTDEGKGASIHQTWVFEWKDSVSLSREPWGYFFILKSRAIPDTSVKIAVLAGGICSPDTTLHICDMGKAIGIAGNIKLEGNLLIPKSGFRDGFLNGKAAVFQHQNGSIYVGSPSNIPTPCCEGGKSTLLGVIASDDVSTSEGLVTKASFKRSFWDAPLLIHSKGQIDMKGVELEGQIIIVSESGVRIDSASILDGVVIIAPSITIEAGCSGRFQAIAGDTLNVGEGCRFQFPTVLALHSDTLSDTPSYMRLGSGCIVEGMVFYNPRTTSDGSSNWLSIGSDTQIEGHLISYAEICAQVKVRGRLTTTGLASVQGGSVYHDLLKDAIIQQNCSSPIPAPYQGNTPMEVFRKLY